MVTQKQPEVIMATPWLHETGADPYRIVLRKFFFSSGKVKEYVTHEEVKHQRLKGKSAYYSGHYFGDLAEAKKDFAKRKSRML